MPSRRTSVFGCVNCEFVTVECAYLPELHHLQCAGRFPQGPRRFQPPEHEPQVAPTRQHVHLPQQRLARPLWGASRVGLTSTGPIPPAACVSDLHGFVRFLSDHEQLLARRLPLERLYSFSPHRLWNRNLTACVQRIKPKFGRFVAFSTTDFSYHGHPSPMRIPGDRMRRSIAMYYYTRGAAPHQ